MDLNLTVRTGLSRFLMLDRIMETGPSHILTKKTVNDLEMLMFSGIEILAQTGAFHVRHLMDFKRHAFLLGIRSYSGPSRLLPGLYTVKGTLLSQSREAFEYHLEGNGPQKTSLEGIFLFASRNYGDDFRQNHLEDHYRKLFTCLTNDTPKNSTTSV